MFTLDEAYEALNGRDEFAVKEYDGLISFDYIVILPTTFVATEEEISVQAYYLWDKAGRPVSDGIDYWLQAEKLCKKWANIRRNFRGVTFDAKTKQMLSLPLNKFYNVNQIAETQYNLIKDKNALIYEKNDGTMIHFFIHNEKLIASTCRSAESVQAKDAFKLLLQKPELYKLIYDEVMEGWTPIFEFIAPDNQVVIFYPEAQLVYLISRNRRTGEYRFNDIYPLKAKTFNFSFSEIYSDVHFNKENFEGYVCHLDNGEIVKVKTNWYNDRHRAVDALMRPKYKLFDIVFQGIMDDLIAVAPENYKPVLIEVYNEAQRDLLNEMKRVEQKFSMFLEKHKEIAIDLKPKSNKMDELAKEIADLKLQGKKLEAIKRVREFVGIGVVDAKNYVEKGIWPHGLILEDEQEIERRRQMQTKSTFVEIVQNDEDFYFIMSMFNGNDPANEIKAKLLEMYKIKYPRKLYANMEVDI